MRMPNHITSRIFKIKTDISEIALVEDIKNHLIFILKDKLSKQWQKSEKKEDFLLQLLKNNFKGAINNKSENIKYFAAKLDKLFWENDIIASLKLELNYKCNLNCKHCYNPKDMDEYSINYEQAKKIIDDAYSSNIYSISLTGGECTINKDFLKIAKYVREKNMPLYILTNAQKLYDDDDLFKEIISIYPNNIQISLYSMNPEIHDYIQVLKVLILKL